MIDSPASRSAKRLIRRCEACLATPRPESQIVIGDLQRRVEHDPSPAAGEPIALAAFPHPRRAVAGRRFRPQEIDNLPIGRRRASMEHARPQKISLGEMRSTGVRGLLIYCADYRCSHSTAISADRCRMTSGYPISSRIHLPGLRAPRRRCQAAVCGRQARLGYPAH
jgi:hypothetical protein